MVLRRSEKHGTGGRSDPADDLRRRAEQRIRERGELPPDLADSDPQQIVQELHAHQIELEMQNEELRRSQQELEDSRAKYFELYDLAPIGYITLDRDGLIGDVT